MNYTLRSLLLILFIVCFMSAQERTGSLSLSEILVNLSQYCEPVGIFNNRNLFVLSIVFHFTHLSYITIIIIIKSTMHQPLIITNQRNCVYEVVDTQRLQISQKCEGCSSVFHGTCAHFGIIWHLGLKILTAFP